ncbi:MAG: hypothetical protein IT541_14765 [Hyphomicrobiales bacterium]|jgi:hypothetical protein|nr:hypothetical protein [Hyphomicrobiales bacterium]
MSDSKFAEHWGQAQFCYFRAEATQNPVIKHLWIQLAQDWIALSENWGPQPDQLSFARRNKQPSEPSLVA